LLNINDGNPVPMIGSVRQSYRWDYSTVMTLQIWVSFHNGVAFLKNVCHHALSSV